MSPLNEGPEVALDDVEAPAGVKKPKPVEKVDKDKGVRDALNTLPT